MPVVLLTAVQMKLLVNLLFHTETHPKGNIYTTIGRATTMRITASNKPFVDTRNAYKTLSNI